MTKQLLVILFISFILFGGCKESKTSNEVVAAEDLETLFKEYQTFKLGINPIEATKAGYAQYNDTIANYVSDEYQSYLLDNYSGFLEKISAIDTTDLGDTQKLALGVMEWDCAIKKEGIERPLAVITSPIYNLPTLELFPLGQIQSYFLGYQYY
jgi:hypothetical protein